MSGKDEDRISDLPDAIVVKILTLVTMKEAGRTSVLSKRWRHVWAYIHVLDFDARNKLDKPMWSKTVSEEEKSLNLRWVNQVVGSYKGQTIDEFRLCFDIDVSNRYSTIDSWVKFAMEKRVKKLELNFDPFKRSVNNKFYTFYGLPISNTITSLKLASVDITGEVLQKFLKICPELEYLSVESSKSLVNLEVVGETLNLKHLGISLCQEIEHIEICAPNLVSFKYCGPIINMPLKRTPKLAKLFIGSDCAKFLTNNLVAAPNCLFQLEELSLELNCQVKHCMKSVDQFPICNRLKQLEVIVYPLDTDDLFCFATLLKACPSLHKFVLKLKWNAPRFKKRSSSFEGCRHDHLKIIEIEGFIGHAIDLEFITYLISSCVALKKIVINPCDAFPVGCSWGSITRARKDARRLRAKLQPGVDLIIL